MVAWTVEPSNSHSLVHPIIHRFFHLFVRPSVHPYIHQTVYFFTHSFTRPSICPFIHPFFNPSVYISIKLSFNCPTYVHPSSPVRMSTHSFASPSNHSSGQPSICSRINPFNYSSIYTSIHPTIVQLFNMYPFHLHIYKPDRLTDVCKSQQTNGYTKLMVG